MYKKIFILLTLCLTFLCADTFVYPDFKSCYNKNVESIVYIDGYKAVAISENTAIAFIDKNPPKRYIKKDPYLNLYLLKSKKPLKPVKIKDSRSLKLGEWIASFDKESMYVGAFAKRNDSLKDFYTIGAKAPKNSIVTCLCCEAYGIGAGNDRFIPSEYILRFLNSEKIFYGDIGLRLKKRGKDVTVSYADPYFLNQKLRAGDILLSLDGNKFKTLREFNDYIFFSKRGKIITIEYARRGKILKAKAQVSQRRGGGFVEETFLERYGFDFDSKMRITGVAKGSKVQELGLKKGDRLISLNGNKIANKQQVKRIVVKSKKKELKFLFDRGGFQFFATLSFR